MRYSEQPQKGLLLSDSDQPLPQPSSPASKHRSRRRRPRRGPKVLAASLIGLLVIVAAAAGLGYFVALPWAHNETAEAEMGPINWAGAR